MTALDLIVEDDSRIGTVRFTMSEENVRTKIALPWVAFCSDSGSIAPEPPFTDSQPHPRAYGSFARVLGKYVREERLLTLDEAIRRLTSFPAANLRSNGAAGSRPDSSPTSSSSIRRPSPIAPRSKRPTSSRSASTRCSSTARR